MPLPERLSAARVYDLEQPRYHGMPIHPTHQPGYFYGLYRRHGDNYRPETEGPRSGASGILTMMEHSGTHIDALCHQASDMLLHGDIPVESVEASDGYGAHGAEQIPPLLGRGVLLDVAGWKGMDRLAPGYAISRHELEACAAEEGVEIAVGDVLLVRTGYGRCWNDEVVYMSYSGVAPDGTRWVAEKGVVAVGADNMTWDTLHDRDPKTNATLFGHTYLLQNKGIYILENLNLEGLAEARQYVFGFIGIPLKLRGATGSPIRPLALVD